MAARSANIEIEDVEPRILCSALQLLVNLALTRPAVELPDAVQRRYPALRPLLRSELVIVLRSNLLPPFPPRPLLERLLSVLDHVERGADIDDAPKATLSNVHSLNVFLLKLQILNQHPLNPLLVLIARHQSVDAAERQHGRRVNLDIVLQPLFRKSLEIETAKYSEKNAPKIH